MNFLFINTLLINNIYPYWDWVYAWSLWNPHVSTESAWLNSLILTFNNFIKIINFIDVINVKIVSNVINVNIVNVNVVNIYIVNVYVVNVTIDNVNVNIINVNVVNAVIVIRDFNVINVTDAINAV